MRLRGEVDGHQFAAQAAQRGAVAVVAEESLVLPDTCALCACPIAARQWQIWRPHFTVNRLAN